MIDTTEILRVMVDCLPDEEKDELYEKEPSDFVAVEGIVQKFALHKERLEEHRETVREWLNQLPDKFHAHGGGGAHFSEMCLDKEGNLWGQHLDMERLCVLGIGLGFVRFPMPRAFWGITLGVPYVCIDTTKGSSNE